MAAKSKAVIAMEEKIAEMQEKLDAQAEAAELAELEAKALKLENQLLEQDNSDANKEIEALGIKVSLSEEAAARLTDEIENMEAPVVINGVVQAEGCVVFKGNGYTEDLKRRGIKIVSKFDVETLRTFINSDWSPSMIMEKFGLTEAQLQSYVWRLSEAELRGDSPIKLDFKRDLFGREG